LAKARRFLRRSHPIGDRYHAEHVVGEIVLDHSDRLYQGRFVARRNHLGSEHGDADGAQRERRREAVRIERSQPRQPGADPADLGAHLRHELLDIALCHMLVQHRAPPLVLVAMQHQRASAEHWRQLLDQPALADLGFRRLEDRSDQVRVGHQQNRVRTEVQRLKPEGGIISPV
jgi:hypothetical protein